MFIQAIIIAGIIGVCSGGGIGTDGISGFGDSARGGWLVDGGPETGTIIEGSDGIISGIGGTIVVVSPIKAVHLIVGFPVVPGGQTQDGLWSIVWQSALLPHNPR